MFDSLEKCLFCVYDKKLNLYKNVFCSSGVEAKHIFIEMANDVSSEFYHRSSDFDCVFIGYFDEKTCILSENRSILCGLDTLVDKKRCELQYMIQTLNYLPLGYFKMPSEMQQDIKDKIDEEVKRYAKYLADNIELDKVEDIKNIVED